MSAISVSLANAIYWLRCPPFLRRYRSFSEFMDEQADDQVLVHYVAEQGYKEFEHSGSGSAPLSIVVGATGLYRPSAADSYWRLYMYEDSLRPLSRALCTCGYVAGMALVLVVLLDNVKFVLETYFGMPRIGGSLF